MNSAGGGQPLHGHGWVWFQQQRDEMSVQIRRSQSLHVRMPRRWGEKTFFFLFLFSWFLNSFVVNSFYWFIHRRCLQRRDRRSIWTPETNHQQLCVVRPRDQYEGFLLGPRDSDSGCSEASGPVTSGPQRPIIRENTQKRCQFTSMADVDKLKLKKKSSYTTAATKEETLEQDRHQPWLNMVFFYSSYIRSHRILFLTILILWTWTTSNLS